MHLLLHACLGLLYSHQILFCSAATDTLSHGRELAKDDRLVSANGKFALGFFQTGSKSHNNTYLGIWFNKVPELTPVWTANQDKPISSQASPHLTISSDGNLIILAQSTVLWSTQANLTTNDTIVTLLNSGNLVLQNSSNSSHTFWESFDYPTDTALSGAKLGWNKITGLNRQLVSRKNSVDQASGIYSAGMDSNGIGFQMWNSSVVYWSSGTWNGKFFSSEPEMVAGSSVVNYTYFKSDQESYFIYTVLDENMIMANVLGVSGQRMMRIWTGQNWIMLGTIPKSDKCEIYATCGPFTICSNNAHTLCSCMKGFSIKSPEDWELEDTSGGCIRNTPLNCGGENTNNVGIADKFYTMPGVRLPPNGKEIVSSANADECAQVCLSNCSCTAYSYGKGGCSIWQDILINVATDYNNGETLSVRLAAKEVLSGKTKRSVGKIFGAIGPSILTMGFIIIIVTLMRRKGKLSCYKVDDGQGGVGIISYKYVDLQRATKNFSEKLGGGSFGSVFKGCLPDSSTIAVKRLDGARQGDKQFRAEVSSIGVIQHINLVKLTGFCCDGDRRLLVYEYMANNSLDAHLFGSNNTYLDWGIRCQIALGVARGLAYLHHSCHDCIIHCDIKPENILLDASFLPKIADFGMAKFLGRDFSRVVTTMRGTFGYLAPEWISGTAITPKVDVYGYGMVLLEIISGRRNWRVKLPSNDDQEGNFSTLVSHKIDDDERNLSVDLTHNHDDYAGNFPVQAFHKLHHGNIESLADPRLKGDVNLEEVERLCKVACWCIQDNEFDRPYMNEVVQFLEGTLKPDMPPMPKLLYRIAGFSFHDNLDADI
ncbi:hypothetical protein QOZ80_9BG0715870 [Eleusine coracana subsp. coracana]|nr:hypothetical protein QOZ80_9BG0715870 [Eleusine coracana subsp. coracana]